MKVPPGLSDLMDRLKDCLPTLSKMTSYRLRSS